MKLAIIIPAYNEEKTIGAVIRAIPKKIPGIHRKEIYVIDDGSSDKTTQIARKAGAKVISHYLNRGLGGALGTGLELAKRGNFDFMITIDADGQHNPKEISKLVVPLVEGKYDACIGARSKNFQLMPWYRVAGNWIMNFITYFFAGKWTSDSQSGFRAFSKQAIRKIQITTNRMEVSSEFISEIGRHQLKFCEVPIETIYTNYSLSKGVRHIDGLKILIKLLFRRLG